MKKLLTLTALGALMFASNASASGFLLREQSVSAMGNAFAGATAGAEDASYSFYNPASITRQKGTNMSLNTTAIVGYVRGFDAFGPNGHHDDRMNHVVNRVVLPSGYVTHQINDQFTAGISLSAPFGLVTDYSSNWAGANHGTLSDLATYNISPMLAYKPINKLSVAAGLQIQYVDATLKNGVLHDMGLPFSTNAKLKGDATDIGYTLGVLYEYSDATRFGVAYRSKINHKLKGDISFADQIAVAGLVNQDITAKLTTPALLTFGIYHDVNDRWSVMAEVQKTYWSSFDDLTIQGQKPKPISVTDENWKDSMFYSIGASYKVNDQWKLRGGLAFDQTPVSDYNRTPRIPDSDRIWISSGVEYKYNDALSFNGGYTYIRAEASEVDLKGTGNDATRGSISARYKGNIHLFGIGLNYKF